MDFYSRMFSTELQGLGKTSGVLREWGEDGKSTEMEKLGPHACFKQSSFTVIYLLLKLNFMR